MTLLGKINSFNHNSDDICEYIERVDQHFSLTILMIQRKRLQYF